MNENKNLEALDYETLWKMYTDTNDEKYLNAMLKKEREDHSWVTSPIA